MNVPKNGLKYVEYWNCWNVALEHILLRDKWMYLQHPTIVTSVSINAFKRFFCNVWQREAKETSDRGEELKKLSVWLIVSIASISHNWEKDFHDLVPHINVQLLTVRDGESNAKMYNHSCNQYSVGFIQWNYNDF